MGTRQDPRVEARLQIRIAGIDVNGRPLLQMVTTRNISRRGALLEGLQGTLKPEETVALTYKNNKARFRVSWVGETGSARAGQIGVQSVDATKCIWDAALLPPPAPDTYAAPARERRKHRRVPCRLGAELYVQGSETLTRVHVTNISLGGCFLEMATLVPDKAQVKLVVWVNDTKLAVQGVVVSRRPGFGVSIKFTELTEEARGQLQLFLQSQVAASVR
ncbi:MAG TPA: PilZ domain-containing protein [Terriglobales bacterium]|nr:PilZ domain-containing protein [Terriglobales bacterium]